MVVKSNGTVPIESKFGWPVGQTKRQNNNNRKGNRIRVRGQQIESNENVMDTLNQKQ